MTTELAGFELIHTKLNRPRSAKDLVPRPRLLKRLNQRLWRPLTLVSAPAGYGKTSLVSAWLERWEGPSAWVSLDEGDSDLSVFLAYLLAAVRHIFPDACAEGAALLKAPTLPPVPAIAGSLLNGLNDIGQLFVLVLDDYQTIRDPAIHTLLAELLRHPPQGLHLVLVTRHNPLLPLNRLRARNLMTEIRAQDLRFTRAEVAALLQQMTQTPVDEAAVSFLEETSEGWVTGLRLALLSVRHQGDVDNLAAALRGSSRYVMDYLFSEVLAHQSPDVQDFLLKSAIMERVCGPLCDAVRIDCAGAPPGSEGASVLSLEAPEPSGQTCLEALAAADLFIVLLDDQGEWYRYHHLFRQFLVQRLHRQLATDEIADLHTLATDWFAQNGLIEEALKHALAGGDAPSAARLVAQHRHALMNQDQWQHLARWLRLFPRQVVESEPELLVLDGWIKQVQWRLADIPAVLEHMEMLLAQPSSSSAKDVTCHLQGEVDTLRSVDVLFSALPEPALDRLQRALTILPADRYYERGYASILLGCGYQMVGDLDAAFALATEGLQKIPSNRMFQTRLLTMLSLVYWMDGDLENLLPVAVRCFQISQESDAALGLSWGLYFQGCVHFQRNDLDAAARTFGAVVDRPYLSHGIAFSNSAFGLAMVYHAQGLPDRARQVADSTVTFMMETQNTSLLLAAQAFQAELALRQERIAEAAQWSSRAGPALRQQAMPGFCDAQLTLPKILLALNTKESRRQAAGYLSELHDFVKSIHNTRFLIEVLALQALLFQAQGEPSAALDVLAQAITLAQPGGFIRLFVDLGPKLKPLLAEAAQNEVAPHYVAQILAAFDSSDAGATAIAVNGTVQATRRGAHPELLDYLTNREMDVLLLLAERLTNKEIAQELGISPETVKQHAVNLYQKLHVNNRRQAVAQARASGILPSD